MGLRWIMKVVLDILRNTQEVPSGLITWSQEGNLEIVL